MALTFVAAAPGATQLTLHHTQLASAEARERHGQGWQGCLAKLVALFDSP